MSDTFSVCNSDDSNSQLYDILKNCANNQSYDTLPIEDFNDVSAPSSLNYYKMLSTNLYSTSSNISCSSFTSDDSFGDNILEENGRISLAYENLCTIPRRIAEKFASYTKCLDLSYNNFRNLSFLTFFEELHTLILDRNGHLDVNTLPFLANLKILWINNCDIQNVTDWVQHIHKQCPALEQLSIMGNPGARNALYCNVAKDTLNPPLTTTSSTADYRRYILDALPHLRYLDGIARDVHLQSTAPHNNNNKCEITSSTSAIKSSATPSRANITTGRKAHSNCSKTSSVLSFKDLLYLKRRKKSYQSSSTN